jgi:hypothetical protein
VKDLQMFFLLLLLQHNRAGLISRKHSNAAELNRLQLMEVKKSRLQIPLLFGLRRVTLQPGETQTLKFPLGKDELRFWSPQSKAWGVEPGAFDAWAGDDSTATLHTHLPGSE